MKFKVASENDRFLCNVSSPLYDLKENNIVTIRGGTEISRFTVKKNDKTIILN